MNEFRPDVVAGRYDPKLFDPLGNMLLVNEVFPTIQGEGDNAGRAAIFVRFAKCNLACKFCDTEFETFTKLHKDEVIDKVRALSPNIPNTPSRIGSRPIVVLTGGEPGIQNLGPLVDGLHNEGFQTAMETSGSVWADWMDRVMHICVSPKVRVDRIPKELIATTNEVKWIVNAAFLKMYEEDPGQVWVLGPQNYLQPESQSPKWTAAAVKLVQQWPWRYKLSIQTHKYIGVP